MFADGQQPEVTQESTVDCELVALDPQGRRVGVGPRAPLVRSGTQMSLDKLQVSSRPAKKLTSCTANSSMNAHMDI